ncbi:MAG: Xaa-Pro peptidase family protein [Candidatus Omnitrophota bacterium]
MTASIKSVCQRLKNDKLDAFFISSPDNVSYLSGFKGKDSFLLITHSKDLFFITDPRYSHQAQKELKGFEIFSENLPVARKIKSIVKRFNIRKIGFEASHLSYNNVKKLQAAFKSSCRLLPLTDIIENLRIIKTKDEITSIRKAISITKTAIKKALDYIRPGMTEAQIAAFLEYQMKKSGAQGEAFPTIVASGANSCMPHAVVSHRKIALHEPIIIDCGCCYNGYNSDLTRTVFLGRIDAQFKSMYNIVRDAQLKAISKIRPGLKASAIDRAAKDYIIQKGYAKFITHSLGHGVGLQVHEAPKISEKNNLYLRPGMVFTIEPGIYVPGAGGVRIEDMVLVTDKSHKVLS